RSALAPRARSVGPVRERHRYSPHVEMLVSDFHRSRLLPSSSRTSPCCTRSPTSAPHTGQEVGIGPTPSQERPLAGCRLSRRKVATGSSLCWPWSPSLPPQWPGLGPHFDGLPMLCDHPT